MKRESNDFRLTKHFSKKDDPKGSDPESSDPEDDDLFDHFSLRATSGQKPLRVDKFLANLLPFTTRSRIKNASQTGSITVNGKEVKVSYKVKPGDEVKLMLPYPPPPELEAEDIPLDIPYEDDDLLIVNKPPGMVVHPSLGHRTQTLIHGLLWHFQHLPNPKKEAEFPRPGLVHRIDKDTSGILVIAKTEYAMAHISKQFFDRTTDREYISLVWGDVQEDKGTVVAHIGRHPRHRKLFYAYPDGSVGKHAVTHYEVLERFGFATLVKCKLETGRTHQIRVHLKFLGHPLFSDERYGGNTVVYGPSHKKYQQFMKNCFEILPRQALHAKSLAFDHPTSGERMSFDSPIPQDMETVIEKMRNYTQHQ
ncbi:MAG: RluA family pseudouridine synthase [Bacteroidetes bacterium]|nr:RluA family pseudouridine synthase [Bacteroidota bacterium]MCB0843833.1 RluA family pseudouridine synthase [Bacteroidota bacterium]